MAEAKGFAYYRNHTTTELWAMLAAGDAWSVEQAGGVWRTARQGLEAARGSFKTNVEDLGQQWRGPASDEFQSRTSLVHDYSVVVEARMREAEETYFPGMVSALRSAQQRAQGENALGESLHPDNDIEDPDDWMHEVKGLTHEQIAALDPQTRSTYTNEHTAWRQARHDELAQTVADLGATYTEYQNTVFAEPAAPPPEGMPGNSTYQQPTTGVFAPTTVDSSVSAAGSNGSATTSQPDGPGVNDENDVAGPWELPSYTNIDEPSGGLASGGTAPNVPVGGAGPVGGTPVTGGGGSLPASGGLFGPGRTSPGAVPGRGTSGVPGRGPATTGPTRGSQPATPGRNGQPGTPGRGTSGRGGQSGAPGRGGQTGNPARGTAGRTGTTGGRGSQPGTPGRTSGTGRSGQPGTPGRGSASRAGTGSGVGKNGSPGANSKRRSGEVEEEETLTRETKYVQAEDIFSAPFDPAVGPAHEGAKHQRAWNKEYDAWKRRQEEEDGDSDRPDRKA